MRQKDLYAELNHPYYVYAPPYTEASGGIRAMHYFCHALNLLGEEAYILTDSISPKLRTPTLTSHIQNQHKLANREPIAIYPEIVDGNPLGTQHVVRYLLNLPGRINKKPIKWLSNEQVFTFAADILPSNLSAPLIQIPLIDRSIYKQGEEEQVRREGKLLFLNRYLQHGGTLSETVNDATEISFRVPFRSHHELSKLYRSAEMLYTYEHSTACYEAMLCGCPVVYIPNPIMLDKQPSGPFGREGWAWGTSIEEIEFAKNTIHKFSENCNAIEKDFWNQINYFIDSTQKHASRNPQNDNKQPMFPPMNPLEDGIQFYIKKDFENAAWLLLEALKQTPTNSTIHIYLSLICAAKKEHDNAQQFLKQAITLSPERHDYIAALGEAYLESSDIDRAAVYLQSAIDIDSKLYDAYPALAQAIRLQGGTSKAIALLRSVADIPSRAQENIKSLLSELTTDGPV